MSNFWTQILDSNNSSSAKRLVTLIMAAHFIVTSFIATFFVFYLIVYTPKGTVNKDLLGLLTKVLEQDFYVILAGLGFIAAENMGQIMLEKAKAKVAGNVAVGSPSVDNVNVETLNVEQKPKEEIKINTQSE
jgi:hypothetical protein